MPVERIVFHEVTQEAIQEALRSPRQVDQDLVQAQEARRILDRLFGYSLSPVLWRRIRAGTSAGARAERRGCGSRCSASASGAAFQRTVYWDAEAKLAATHGKTAGDADTPGRGSPCGQRRLRTPRLAS